MDIYAIRQQLRSKNMYDIPLRVTFYARVSSEKDAQLNSLDNQITYYKNLINDNKAWTYIDGYIDEGITAVTTKKRENFHKMIDDAKKGAFDFIITKEITRFARNTLDSIQYTRDLLSCGVGVFFQNDNINTLDEDSELRLTIMSGIAQDESRKLSSRIKFGHQQAIKKSVILGNNRIFGYIKDGKNKLIIDEEEAKMVKELYELYSTDNYSMKQIEKIFWDKGYRNLNGNKIAHTTMSNIISNPKYKGYYCGNKVRIIDMFTKKQKFLPPEEWVMFKDETGEIVPAIVDEELWERANAILQRRSKDVKNRQGICNHDNLFTGKLFCTHCGKPYYKKLSKGDDALWMCSGKIANGKDSCPSFSIYESELKPVLFQVFEESSSNVEQLIEKYISMYKSLNDNDSTLKSIDSLNKKIDISNKKKSKLLEYNINGDLSDRDFIKMNNQLAEEILNFEKQIEDLKKQKESKDQLSDHINNMRKLLKQAQKDARDKIIDKAFVKKYIDKIYITPHENKLKLDIKVFTGENIEKHINKFKSCTGNTSLTINPIQTNCIRTNRHKKGHIQEFIYEAGLSL